MSYNNNNFVCFNCRTCYAEVSCCSNCNGNLVSIGHKIEIPKKKKVKEWNQLKELLKTRNPYIKHKIECQEQCIDPDPLFSEYKKDEAIITVEKHVPNTMAMRLNEHKQLHKRK